MTNHASKLPAGLTIRKCVSDDIPCIESMVRSAYSKYTERIGRPPAPMSANYAELCQTHDVWVLTVDHDGGGTESIVGAVVLRVDEDSASVKINNLVVDQASQGRGYGRILMSFAEDEARAQGLSALTLFTNVKMYENLALYPKLGFEETERRTEDGYERVFFRKDLS